MSGTLTGGAPATAARRRGVPDGSAPRRRPQYAHARRPTPVPKLGYHPSLDGLRGIGLLFVVAYHAGAGLHGAFLAVSMFFTLSGFLITYVILMDLDPRGRVDMRRFYSRRARRLVPAALAAVALITVLTVVLGDATQQARLRSEGLSALTYTANWRWIITGNAYEESFASPSPFAHFWTLAVEEQFYLVFPLVVTGALWFGRGSRRALAWILGLAAAAALGWSMVLVSQGVPVDRLYIGTDTRLPELLLGALLALWWARGPRLSPSVQRGVAWAGVAGVAVMLGLWFVVERSDLRLYQGGLVLYSLLVVLVIVACLQPASPLHRVLGWKPLVFLGVLSYGAYLLHWPILIMLQMHTTWSVPVLFLVGGGLTVVLAWLSLRFFERPVRVGRMLPGHRAGRALVGTTVAVLVLVVGLTAIDRGPPAALDLDDAATRLDDLQAGIGAPPTTPVDPAVQAAIEQTVAGASPEQRQAWEAWASVVAEAQRSTAPRVAFFGDSTALLSSFGVTTWLGRHLDVLVPVKGVTQLGCGLVPDAHAYRGGLPGAHATSDCQDWAQKWEVHVQDQHVDLAVVQLGPWDVHDTQLEAGGPWLVVGRDAEMDQLLRTRLDDAVTRLARHTDAVVVLLPPDVEYRRVEGRSPAEAQPASDPARMAAFRAIVEEVVARHPTATTVDLAGFVARHGDDARLRPDGVHLGAAGTEEVGAWLAPELRRAYDRAARENG